MSIKTLAVAFTGGIDSTVLAYNLWHERSKHGDIYLVACDYGQANWKVTEKIGQFHAQHLGFNFVPLKVILPDFVSHGGLFEVGYKPPKANGPTFDYSEQVMSYAETLVPYRNAFLFLWMMSWCQKANIQTLLTGHQYEDSEWDNVESFRHRTEDFGIFFLDRINLLAEVGAKRYVRTQAPFLETKMDKLKIVKLGLRLGVDLVKETYSCQYMPKCQLCDNCINRKRIFAEVGLLDD